MEDLMLLEDHDVLLVTSKTAPNVQVMNAFGTPVLTTSLPDDRLPTSSVEAAVYGLTLARDMGYRRVAHQVEALATAKKIAADGRYRSLRDAFERVDLTAPDDNSACPATFLAAKSREADAAVEERDDDDP
jgi:hypothetical protein